MESIFTFFAELPTYYYYIGGVILLVLLYQRYDENNRYNSKSGPIPEKPESSKPVPSVQTESIATKKTPKTIEVMLNQQMIDFLKKYDPSQDSWTNWVFKKVFPADILEDLSDSVKNEELKSGMKIKIHDGDWEMIKQ